MRRVDWLSNLVSSIIVKIRFYVLQGLAKYGLKALLTLLRTHHLASQQDAAEDSSYTELLQCLWSVAWARVVDGIDTFGSKQATVKLIALQVGNEAQIAVFVLQCWSCVYQVMQDDVTLC